MPKPNKEKILTVGGYTYIPLTDPIGAMPSTDTPTHADPKPKAKEVSSVTEQLQTRSRVSSIEELMACEPEPQKSSWCCCLFFARKKRTNALVQEGSSFQQKLMR